MIMLSYDAVIKIIVGVTDFLFYERGIING